MVWACSSPVELSIVVGGTLVLLGVLMLIDPVAHLEADRIHLCNALGMTFRTFPVNSPADVWLDGKVLRHVPSGDQKILSLGFAIDPQDAAAVKAQLPAQ